MQVILRDRPVIPDSLRRQANESSKLALEGNLFEAAERDRLFHRSIVDLANNKILLELYDSLQYHHLMACVSVPAEIDKVREIVDEHNDILDALSTYDAERASELLQHHLDPSVAPRYIRRPLTLKPYA